MMSFTVEKRFISYDLSAKLINEAINHAKKLRIIISVAVVDPRGDLVAFAKMDNCNIIGIGTAQAKAYTAARGGLNTQDLHDYFKEHSVPFASLQSEKLMLIGGGLPIHYQGQLIGGIGIGGATSKQDEECAQVALQYLINNPC